MTVYDTTQAPLSIRNGLAVLFDLPESKVRVVAPDVGGGFGTKIMMFYAEEVLGAAGRAAAEASGEMDRGSARTPYCVEPRARPGPLVYHRDRPPRARSWELRTGFFTTPAPIRHTVSLFPIITATQLPGPYKVPNYTSDATVVYTNKVPVTPYRGAGGPMPAL